MATFKIIAGDFGSDKTGFVHIGGFYKKEKMGFTMPKKGTFMGEFIGKSEVSLVQMATEESLKKMGGAIGWGLVGGLALGGIGAIAGLLAGGNKKELTFVLQFKDGRKLLGSADAKTFTQIQASCF